MHVLFNKKLQNHAIHYLGLNDVDFQELSNLCNKTCITFLYWLIFTNFSANTNHDFVLV